MKKKKSKNSENNNVATKIATVVIVGSLACLAGLYIKDNYYKTPEINKEKPQIEQEPQTQRPSQKTEKKEVQKSQITVYMVKNINNEEKIVKVKREVKQGEDAFDVAIKALFKGPSQSEKDRGVISEIPSTVRLLSIKKQPDSIIIDISGEFSFDGGAGLFVRLKQLINTAVTNAGGKKVYLYIDGVKAEVIGGDGIMIKQPLDIKDNFSQ